MIFFWEFTDDAPASFLDNSDVAFNASYMLSCSCCVDDHGIHGGLKVVKFHVHKTCSNHETTMCINYQHFFQWAYCFIVQLGKNSKLPSLMIIDKDEKVIHSKISHWQSSSCF